MGQWGHSHQRDHVPGDLLLGVLGTEPNSVSLHPLQPIVLVTGCHKVVDVCLRAVVVSDAWELRLTIGHAQRCVLLEELAVDEGEGQAMLLQAVYPVHSLYQFIAIPCVEVERCRAGFGVDLKEG